MRPVVWSPAAQRDVARVYRYLEPLNPIAARRIAAELYASTDILERFPELGRQVARGRREWGFRDYVIVYRTQPDKTRILRVWHGAQDRPGSRPPQG